KSKVKWAIEGDENSKFFHGIINKKRSQLTIRRILQMVIGLLIPMASVLTTFYLASGLKINLQKSHVLGVGVPYEDVRHGASLIGCDVMRTPFKYLGVTVGDFMSRNSAWVNVIQKSNLGCPNGRVKPSQLAVV
nr:RNA-directed DNA polymerase, eukaryota [Tanacetum cinerariifolium]